MSRRGAVATIILVLWAAGLVLLVRRAFFRPRAERLAEAAMRITPGAEYYAVLSKGEHVGYASSTIDTMPAAVVVTDYLVAELPGPGRPHRTEARSQITLTRGLHLTSFRYSLASDSAPVRAEGRLEGDSVVVLVLRAGRAKPDTQRISVQGPVLLPAIVPLAVALGDQPTVGRSYTLPLLDIARRASRPAAMRVAAESLFVIADSAVFDSTTKRWQGALPDTVRAWQLASDDSAAPSGWVDAQGRLVRTTQLGTLTLERMPHEMAFENWRLRREEQSSSAPADPKIQTSTLIEAGLVPREALNELRVRLAGTDLSTLELDGGDQRLDGDVLTTTRAQLAALDAAYRIPDGARARFPRETAPASLIESDAKLVRLAAIRTAGLSGDPRTAAQHINQWVYRVLEKRHVVGIPGAEATVRSRQGDCDEHTRLAVAMFRAAGIPAREVAGLLYVNGTFHYHAWPEVWLGQWVPTDPTLDQFPADAGHLRLVTGGLDGKAELMRVMGQLQVNILATR